MVDNCASSCGAFTHLGYICIEHTYFESLPSVVRKYEKDVIHPPSLCQPRPFLIVGALDVVMQPTRSRLNTLWVHEIVEIASVRWAFKYEICVL